jgi:hypothetical protein
MFISAGLVSSLHSLGADPAENTVFVVIAQQYLDCFLYILCLGNLFTKSLRRNERLLWRHVSMLMPPYYRRGRFQQYKSHILLTVRLRGTIFLQELQPVALWNSLKSCDVSFQPEAVCAARCIQACNSLRCGCRGEKLLYRVHFSSTDITQFLT